MNFYTLYIINNDNGTTRDVIVYSKDSYSARKNCEESILNSSEEIKSVFPISKTPSEE